MTDRCKICDSNGGMGRGLTHARWAWDLFPCWRANQMRAHGLQPGEEELRLEQSAREYFGNFWRDRNGKDRW